MGGSSQRAYTKHVFNWAWLVLVVRSIRASSRLGGHPTIRPPSAIGLRFTTLFLSIIFLFVFTLRDAFRI